LVLPLTADTTDGASVHAQRRSVKAGSSRRRIRNDLHSSPDGTRLTGSLIAPTATDPNPNFHVGVVTVDGSSPVVILPDGGAWSWQPVVAPLPAAPSFPAESPAS
jgi:hypothetical protein